MKAMFTSLTTTLVLAFVMTSCYAQSYSYGNNGYERDYDRGVSVQATSADISYNLDLRAVSSVFADSRNLEEFERRLNDYNEGINNLDLNQDGRVDYLRVIETSKGRDRLVVIQAVLDRDAYQDVASIVLERRYNSRTYVQVIGDPYLYGPYYIIEPVYVYTPPIFSFFWGAGYYRWHSPYYWGYYPSYYSYYNPRPVNVYVNNINIYVDKSRNTYNYSDRIRSNEYNSMRREVSRSDYERSNPDRSFASRNTESRVSNRRDLGEFNARSSRSSGDINSSRSSGARVGDGAATSRGSADVNSRVNTGTSRSSAGSDANRTTRSREEWNTTRQSRNAGEVNGNVPSRTRQDVNSGSRTSRGSSDYPARTNNSGAAEQPTRTRTTDDVYSRPSRSNSDNSGTYSSPSRTNSNGTSRSSDTYSAPARSSAPTRNEGYSQPNRSSSAPARTETYSQPSRSSSSGTYSAPSRSSSESSSSRSSSSENSGRSGGGRR